MRNDFFDAIAKGPGGTVRAYRLVDLTGFGSNPGALRARVHVPARLTDRPALVVVLHGCTQTAAGYDHGSGWSQLADRHGFVLLYPEQERSNNANLCFNWFEPGDTARGAGEALSIHQMIEAVSVAHAIDCDRIFVTGLSAGGAMASVMLATYPETFAGGAIIAGLPYGCASNVQQAFGAMRSRGQARPDALAALIQHASGHDGPWPKVSVWHGSGDSTVNPNNADAIVEQWLPIHGVVGSPPMTDIVDGYPHRAWRAASGQIVVEAYSITGMGHGIPLDANAVHPVGAAGPYMLSMGISSSKRIAEFWGLTSDTIPQPEAAKRKRDASSTVSGTSVASRVPQARRLYPEPKPAPVIDVRRIIEDALRAGGLLK
ncbi:PHB depolymerase family esterase [Sphingomonas sp. CROZ-RG-20F-R02-07]|uniref:extracellular catalytic domain type 1 short-chain-length polyhydroxyalkanoate depolymerase n=1 Tax=Sphingomonas sp. CROZ-RG-20F-R02-07 TaxID=2914832 RepID=UPI001F56023C